MTNSYQHIYLSPHYDDASLSCGGAIHQQVQAGKTVLVVTICAAPPSEESLSAYAEAMHQNWGSPDDMIAYRRAEDRASMAVLGADGHHLSLTDCIYRGDPRTGMCYYNSDADIFGDIHPLDLKLATDIATAVAELVLSGSIPTIYAPLGVGHHVDHQLAHAAAWQLREQGQRVVFYEDYPYVDPRYPFTPYSAENRHGLAVTLTTGRTAELRPQLRPLSAENLQAKIDSVRAYSSQLQILFGGEETMAVHVRNYALFVGQSSPAERIWVSR